MEKVIIRNEKNVKISLISVIFDDQQSKIKSIT